MTTAMAMTHARKPVRLLALAAGLCLSAFAHAQSPPAISSGQPASAQAVQAVQAAQGRDYFRSKGCYQCHGLVGQGAIGVGPPLAPVMLSTEAFSAYVRKPTRQMPPYSEHLLGKSELEAILAYLKSLPKPRAADEIAVLAPFVSAQRNSADKPSAAATPVRGEGAAAARAGTGSMKRADETAGQGAYRQHCAACHGTDLEGGAAPSLRGVASRYSREAIAALIRNPPAAMPKLAPNPLPDNQVELIAAYVHATGGAKPGAARPAQVR